MGNRKQKKSASPKIQKRKKNEQNETATECENVMAENEILIQKEKEIEKDRK